MKIFHSNANPISLDLSNCELNPSTSPAILQSLIPHSFITCLSFMGNRLHDSTMIELASLLKALPNLFTLNISCINISINGITSLSQCVKSFITNGVFPCIIMYLSIKCYVFFVFLRSSFGPS